jgi:tetratricopeptide (TPR) repeat protein
MRISRAFGVALLGTLSLSAQAIEWKIFDPAPYSQSVTDCDREAAHPDDPNKVLPGKTSREMNLETAIRVCRADLKNDQNNPRLKYQLARSLTYAGKVTEALPFIEEAATQKYPLTLFVVGYLYLEESYASPKDPCRAATLIRESAIHGRLAGLLGYPSYVLNGRFAGCSLRVDPQELREFVRKAKTFKLDYYPSVLAESLDARLR